MRYDFSKKLSEDVHIFGMQIKKDGFPQGIPGSFGSIVKTIHCFVRIIKKVCYYRFSANA
jgi:hypothetical protein